MLKVMVHGNGRMGKAILSELQSNSEFICAGTVERTGKIPECDLVIDVTSHEGTAALLPRLDHQMLVVGTTGDLPLAELGKYAARDHKVAVTQNFSPDLQAIKQLLSEMTLSVFEKFGIRFDVDTGEPLNNVIISNDSDTIELKHIVHDQENKAKNALKIATWLSRQENGMYRL